MKKIASLFLLLCLASAFHPVKTHAQSNATPVVTVSGVGAIANIIPTAGPQVRADNTSGVTIADREANTKVALGHAEYTESARRGKLFTLTNNAYTIVAQNATNGAIGTAKPIVGFYNPTGSGVNAVLINAEEWHTSGTPGGPLIFNYYCGQNWTSVSSGTIYNDLLSNNTPNGSQMIAQVNQNLNTTPAITSTMLSFSPLGGPETTVLTTSSGLAGHTKDLKGQIAVPPGCAFGVFATGTGTSDVVNASLTWEEVAQ